MRGSRLQLPNAMKRSVSLGTNSSLTSRPSVVVIGVASGMTVSFLALWNTLWGKIATGVSRYVLPGDKWCGGVSVWGCIKRDHLMENRRTHTLRDSLQTASK